MPILLDEGDRIDPYFEKKFLLTTLNSDLANAAFDNLLLRMSYAVMVSGEALSMPSICGVNCSYTTEFEGPYLGCDNSTSTDWYNTTSMGNSSLSIYQGSVYDPSTVAGFGPPVTYNGTYSTNFFQSSTLSPLLANEAALTDFANTSVLARSDDVKCSFQRAKYVVNHQYVNSVHSRTVIAMPIDKLVNLVPDTYDNVIFVPGIGTPQGLNFGTTPANWTESTIAVYRDFQHCQIIESMLFYLQGNFTGYPSPTANTTNSTATPGFLEAIGWSNGAAGAAETPGKFFRS